MVLAGRFLYRFVVVFRDQGFFSKGSFVAASNNGVLQLFLLAANANVLMRYQLHLTCVKDEHLDM